MGIFAKVAKGVLTSPAVGLVIFLFIIDFVAGDFIFTCPCDDTKGSRYEWRFVYALTFLLCPILIFSFIDKRFRNCCGWSRGCSGMCHTSCRMCCKTCCSTKVCCGKFTWWITIVRPATVSFMYMIFFLCSQRFADCFEGEKLCDCTAKEKEIGCTKERKNLEAKFQIAAMFFLIGATVLAGGNIYNSLKDLDSSTMLTLHEEGLLAEITAQVQENGATVDRRTPILYTLDESEVKDLSIPLGQKKILWKAIKANRPVEANRAGEADRSGEANRSGEASHPGNQGNHPADGQNLGEPGVNVPLLVFQPRGLDQHADVNNA